MMICESCGAVFEYPNIRTDSDTGTADAFCPECHSEYIMHAVQCELCGEWVQEDEAYGYGHAVCEKCIEDQSDDLELLYEASKDEYYEPELPAIFEQFYSVDDIKELLLADLKKRQEAGYIHSKDIKQFVRWHKNDIADQLVKEYGR